MNVSDTPAVQRHVIMRAVVFRSLFISLIAMVACVVGVVDVAVTIQVIITSS